MKQRELSGEKKNNLMHESSLCFRNLHGVPRSVLKQDMAVGKAGKPRFLP